MEKSVQYFEAFSVVFSCCPSKSLEVSRGDSWELVCTFRHDLFSKNYFVRAVQAYRDHFTFWYAQFQYNVKGHTYVFQTT